MSALIKTALPALLLLCACASTQPPPVVSSDQPAAAPVSPPVAQETPGLPEQETPGLPVQEPRAAAAPSPPAAAAQAGPAEGTAAAALAAHNRERERVGVAPLQWDPELGTMAKAWARHLCKTGNLEHRWRQTGGPGENLWQGATTEAEAFPVTEAVQSWAAEQRHYDARSGQCKGGTCGHYTQVVWRATTHVGCGVATCVVESMNSTVWVCNYRPAGNLLGERAF